MTKLEKFQDKVINTKSKTTGDFKKTVAISFLKTDQISRVMEGT